MNDTTTAMEPTGTPTPQATTAPAPAAGQPEAQDTGTREGGHRSAIELAFERASARKHSAPETATPPSAPPEQAAPPAEHAAGQAAGVSPPPASGADPTPAAADSMPGAPPPGEVSSSEIPAHLPEGMRTFLQALPEQHRAQHLAYLTEVTKGVQGFLQRHAETRRNYGEIEDAMTGLGLDQTRVVGFMRGLQSDPGATIRALAEQFQVDLETGGDPKRPEDFASLEQFEQYLDAKYQRRAEQRERAAARAAALREQEAAYAAEHAALAASPGYNAGAIDDLVRRSNGGLSPRMAYDLLQVGALRRENATLRAAKAELDKLKQERETAAKAAMASPGLGRVSQRPSRTATPTLSPAAAAYERAAKRRTGKPA